MKKNSVYKIDPKNLVMPLPLNITLWAWLLMDRFNAPGWVWGVVGTFLFLFWLVGIIALFASETVDISEFLKEKAK